MATRSDDELLTTDEEWDDAEPEDIEDGLEDDLDDDDDLADDETDGEDGEEPKEETEDALDELESEELEMLTEDEANETLAVDEAAEMRAIRRAELAMSFESPNEAQEDEFVCQSCFLVKRSTQLADKRRKWCTDCAG